MVQTLSKDIKRKRDKKEAIPDLKVQKKAKAAAIVAKVEAPATKKSKKSQKVVAPVSSSSEDESASESESEEEVAAAPAADASSDEESDSSDSEVETAATPVAAAESSEDEASSDDEEEETVAVAAKESASESEEEESGSEASDAESSVEEEVEAKATPMSTEAPRRQDHLSIFVANIPFSVNEESLGEHFKECGEVKQVVIPTDRETNRKRGFAFVEFADTDAVEKALELNDTELEGRQIVVKRGNEKKEKPIAGGVDKPRCTTRTKNIFIRNVGFETTSEEIERVFSAYGQVAVKLLTFEDTGRCRGIGFLDFEDQEAADKVEAEREFEIDGRKVQVEYAGEKSDRPNAGGAGGFSRGRGGFSARGGRGDFGGRGRGSFGGRGGGRGGRGNFGGRGRGNFGGNRGGAQFQGKKTVFE